MVSGVVTEAPSEPSPGDLPAGPNSMDSPADLEQRIRRNLRQRLESLQRAGVEQLGRARPVQAATDGAAPAPDTAAPPPEPVALDLHPPAIPATPMPRPPITPATAVHLSPQEKDTQLQSLCQQVRSCRRCPDLVANRTQTVFGVGNPQTRLCFFGEAPAQTKTGRASRLSAAPANCSTKSSKPARCSAPRSTS